MEDTFMVGLDYCCRYCLHQTRGVIVTQLSTILSNSPLMEIVHASNAQLKQSLRTCISQECVTVSSWEQLTEW